MQAVNYRYIVEELKRSLVCPEQSDKPCVDYVREKVRSRLVFMLDVDPESSLEMVIERLTEKWRQDGLL